MDVVFQCESAVNGDMVEGDEDPNVLLLMRHLDKKTRKISFLKDHVNHLTEELHRKSKSVVLIFVMRRDKSIYFYFYSAYLHLNYFKFQFTFCVHLVRILHIKNK